MSSFEDCQNFLRFVVNCFVDKPLILDQKRLTKLKSAEPMESAASYDLASIPNGQLGHANGQTITPSPERITPSEDTVSKEGKNNGSSHTLTNLFIYPVKSCASVEVEKAVCYPSVLTMKAGWCNDISFHGKCSVVVIDLTGDRVATGTPGFVVWPFVDGCEWEWSLSEPEKRAKAVSHPSYHLSGL